QPPSDTTRNHPIYLPSFLHVYFFFFFSSRRRHTRCLSDWSSDVCSSDLPLLGRLTASRDHHRTHTLSGFECRPEADEWPERECKDRKSTRLNSSHLGISYAVFCLKKKKKP